MCEFRNLTRKEKEFLIRNNYDPKEYLFYGETESTLVFYNIYFKNLWSIAKKGHTSPSKVKVSPKQNTQF